MSEWRPIETAPRDGTAILVFSPGVPEERIYAEQFVVRRMIAMEDGEEDWIIYRQLGASGFVVVTRNPTHWMPLPEPPQAEAAA